LTEEVEENKRWSGKRFRVEQVFRIAKRCYGFDSLSYVGSLPNKVKAFIAIIAINIKSIFNIIKRHKNALPLYGLI